MKSTEDKKDQKQYNTNSARSQLINDKLQQCQYHHTILYVIFLLDEAIQFFSITVFILPLIQDSCCRPVKKVVDWCWSADHSLKSTALQNILTPFLAVASIEVLSFLPTQSFSVHLIYHPLLLWFMLLFAPVLTTIVH